MKALECKQVYFDFSDAQWQLTPKFELIQAFIVVLVTCKNEKDPIKMKALECDQDFPPFYGNFLRCSRAANSAVLSRIELIRDSCPDYLQGKT